MRFLDECGLPILLTGGGGREEVDYANELACRCQRQVTVLAGRCSWAEVAHVLSRCAVYLGVDTAATHLAASLNAPTVALYGRPNRMYLPYHSTWLDHTLYATHRRRTRQPPCAGRDRRMRLP